VRFVDTNVFLRYIVGDDPERSPASRDLLVRCDAGEEELYTSESVIGEIFYVLTRGRESYRVDRVELAQRVKPILNARGLQMPQKPVIQRALDLYIEYPEFDFEDAVSMAQMESQGIQEIVSYDEDFDGKPEVVRVEP
jgi:predicted nucleic acid-binding protein